MTRREQRLAPNQLVCSECCNSGVDRLILRKALDRPLQQMGQSWCSSLWFRAPLHKVHWQPSGSPRIFKVSIATSTRKQLTISASIISLLQLFRTVSPLTKTTSSFSTHLPNSSQVWHPSPPPVWANGTPCEVISTEATMPCSQDL